jgi:hypothetical protein
MLSGKFTKFGSLVLNKTTRENLGIAIGNKYKFAIDKDEDTDIKTLYFIKTDENDKVFTVEVKRGLVYMRLSKCLKGMGVKLPCYCAMVHFRHIGDEGFKITLIQNNK